MKKVNKRYEVIQNHFSIIDRKTDKIYLHSLPHRVYMKFYAEGVIHKKSGNVDAVIVFWDIDKNKFLQFTEFHELCDLQNYSRIYKEI